MIKVLVVSSLLFVHCFFVKSFEEERRLKLEKWKVRWELAKVLKYAKRYDEASIEYEKLIKAKPRLYEAKVELVNMFLEIGKICQALVWAEKIPIRKLDAKSRLELADLYFKRNDLGKAEKLYKSKKPYGDEVRLRLADIYHKKGDNKKSFRKYRKLIGKHPHDIQLRRRYAFLLKENNRAEAEEELKKSLKVK